MRPCDNPFRVDRLHSLAYVPVGTTWPALLDRLAALEYRAAIVGPLGRGKSTLLRDLAARLAATGRTIRHYRVREGEPVPEEVSSARGWAAGDVILIDGVDRVPAGVWRALRRSTRGAGGLVVAGHRARGLPVLVRCLSTPALLRKVIESLSDEASLSSQAERLHRAHRGNVREALFELYDIVAGGDVYQKAVSGTAIRIE